MYVNLSMPGPESKYTNTQPYTHEHAYTVSSLCHLLVLHNGRTSGLRDVDTHWLLPATKQFWVASVNQGGSEKVIGGVGIDLVGGKGVRSAGKKNEGEKMGERSSTQERDEEGTQQQQQSRLHTHTQRQEQEEQGGGITRQTSEEKHASIHHLVVSNRCPLHSPSITTYYRLKDVLTVVA